jgi:predicted DsbA family dithiol-disulfide isomerase
MIVEVFQDTVCPWCRIGKKNLTDALEKWSGEPVEVHYRAYQLDPTTPIEGYPFQETMTKKFGGTPDRLHAMLQQVTSAGEAVGVKFNFAQVEKMPNTIKSHQFIALVPQEKQQAAVDAIYKAYFEDGKDIGDIQVLLQIAKQLDIDHDDLSVQLQSKAGLEQVEGDFEFASKVGITGVPFFIVNNKYALTGAQPASTFLQVLEQVAVEE